MPLLTVPAPLNKSLRLFHHRSRDLFPEQVRKIAGLGGSILHAIFLLAFGLVKSPQQSMLAYCGVTATQCVYGSGHIPNYMEVGGSCSSQ